LTKNWGIDDEFAVDDKLGIVLVLLSFSQILVLSSSRPLEFSSSRILVLPRSRSLFLVLLSFSRILGFSDSRPLVLSSSRPLVLSKSRAVEFSSNSRLILVDDEFAVDEELRFDEELGDDDELGPQIDAFYCDTGIQLRHGHTTVTSTVTAAFVNFLSIPNS
jgi:hypothetical protein